MVYVGYAGMRSSSLPAAALLVAAVAACVPSTDVDADPRGAAGARFVPTAIARGTPFVTSDGWTITFERIALVALVSTLDRYHGGASRFVIWDGAQETETYVPSMPIGALAVKVDLEGLVRNPSYAGSSEDPDIQKVLTGSTLAPDVRALVLAAPDNTLATLSAFGGSGPIQGPAVIFAARATKDGRTVRIALALATAYLANVSTSSDLTGVQALDVRANDVRFAAYEVHPDRIFAATADEAATLFDPFANADRNGDGIVAAGELHAVRLATAPPEDAGVLIDPSDAPSCSAAGIQSFACLTLLDRISDNAQHIVVPGALVP